MIGDLNIDYLERMDPLLDLVLEPKAVQDPQAFFNVEEETNHKKDDAGKGNAKYVNAS